MSADTYPKFKAAVVQAAPVWLNRDATIEKVEALTTQAAREGAVLVVFSESYLPAFPVWNLIHRPPDQPAFFRRLYDNALLIPSASFRKLAEIAHRCHVYLSLGVSEKTEVSQGTLWNANLLFNPEGRLINWRRKLVPTLGEKLTYAPGDAAGLKAVPTDLGRIGVLICGENMNTLARFALLAQGEQVHITTFTPFWPFPPSPGLQPHELAKAIAIRTAGAHSSEGKLFTLVSAGLLDEEAKTDLAQGSDDIRQLLDASIPPVSTVVGPAGFPLVEPLVGQEGILYAEIDISQNIEPRLAHDITGGYQRFDLFHLRVDQTPYTYEGVAFENHFNRNPLAFLENADSQEEGEITLGFPSHSPDANR